MAEKVSASERVLDLMIALINAPARMTKSQIRAKVNGYQHGGQAAFERTFERDKDLLRSLGIPLATVRDAVHEDDVGYRIDVDSYRVPDTEFTPQELGVLALASSVHGEAVWRSQAGRGVTKARALGPATGETAPPLRLSLRSPEKAFDAILDAIESRRIITFIYAGRSTPRARRTVQPWHVITRWSAWYLLGWDADREAPRAFRLSRIHGAVQEIGDPGAFEIPATIDADAILGSAAAPVVTARVALAPDRAALLRSRGRGDGQITLHAETEPRDVVVLEAPDEPAFAEELAGYGADAVVLGPPRLRADVLTRLRAVGEVRHAG